MAHAVLKLALIVGQHRVLHTFLVISSCIIILHRFVGLPLFLKFEFMHGIRFHIKCHLKFSGDFPFHTFASFVPKDYASINSNAFSSRIEIKHI